MEAGHTPAGPSSLGQLVLGGAGSGVCRLPTPRAHPAPHPHESAPLLKAQQNPQVTSWPAPNKSLEPAVQELTPYHFSGLIRRAAGSESARSDWLLHDSPGACSQPSLSVQILLLLPSPPLMLPCRPTIQPSGIVSGRNQINPLWRSSRHTGACSREFIR